MATTDTDAPVIDLTPAAAAIFDQIASAYADMATRQVDLRELCALPQDNPHRELLQIALAGWKVERADNVRLRAQRDADRRVTTDLAQQLREARKMVADLSRGGR